MMNFDDVLKVIEKILGGLNNKNYDGIAIKKLESSNTLDEGRSSNQTHIAISGEQMDIFPYLRAEGYFSCSYEERDEQLKKYFITQIPINLFRSNIEYLGGNNIDYTLSNENSTKVHASIMRSRRKNQSDQVQLSLISFDDRKFINFRKLLHIGDFIIILKHKEKLEYDFFGVKACDAKKDNYNLIDLNNRFFKLQTHTKIDIEKIAEICKNNDIVTGGQNILYYGVPGSGKSHAISNICSDESVMQRVVFHPDYTYSDFVGQIMPRVNEQNKLEYVFSAGPFTKILDKAYHNPSKMHYLVIEEINRGNAPAIFGEVFQLLDRKDKDDQGLVGESEYGISNYEIAQEVYGDPQHLVKIPSNLSILATMNTSDQNVFTLDTAFQRRWELRHIKNNVLEAKHADSKIEDTDITWGAFASVINDKIDDISYDMSGLEDKRLGAYFAKEDELEKRKFPEKVLKYLWDDAFKMDKEAIFNEDIKSFDNLLSIYEDATPDKLKWILNYDVYGKMLNKVKKADSEKEDNN